MAWSSAIVTLRCSNESDFTPYRDVHLDCLAAVPVPAQDESGERESPAGGLLLQNLAVRWEMPLVVRRISIGDAEFDYGHLQQAVAAFGARYIRIQTITGHDYLKGDIGAGNYTYWGTGLPRSVIVEYDTPSLERKAGALAQLNWSVTLRDVLPVIGVTIT